MRRYDVLWQYQRHAGFLAGTMTCYRHNREHSLANCDIWSFAALAALMTSGTVSGQTLQDGISETSGTPAVLACPVDGGHGWTNTRGSPFHAPGKGIGGADDTYAFDLNLNTPAHDSDNGKPVRAVADGVIYTGNGWGGGSYGQLLVSHTEPDGTTWSSGYLHMQGIVKKGGSVRKGEIIGCVSSKGAGNAHLHFAAYADAVGKRSYKVMLACLPDIDW